ncbi:MAG: peptide chain release factor N(5)-glutamine methyltransferase [Prolixibacteraceae bacterium]|jgi:release factor glutamine methyltransferase
MPQRAIFQEFLLKIEGKLNILVDKPEENDHNTLSALWHTAAGNRVSAITSEKLGLPILDSDQINFLEEMIQSRLSGMPLAHLTERQHFMGLDYILNAGHYIPRKDTELLAKTSIELLKKEFDSNERVNVIDLCSGIGTVALTIAHYRKNTVVFGSDIYKPAIEAANINAKHLGLDQLATFYHADMFDPFGGHEIKGNTDIIVSAPPYITSVKAKQMEKEILEHEPIEAFDAGPFGMSIFNKLISVSPEYLCHNGYLIFECGQGQGEFLSKRLQLNGNYGEVEEICDEHGHIRVLKAQKIK